MRYLKDKLARLVNQYKSLSARQRRLRIFSFVILTVLVAVALGIPTATKAFSWVDVKDGFLNALSYIFMWLAEICIKLTIFALKFVIEIGGYNGYIDSKAVTVGWVMVRDIGNMFFVVILLLIAFGTILGIESYEWKKLLVKFFFAAVLINFSRIICGLIIDVSQVVMITFINGVAATAGGNLISFFNFTDIMKLSSEVAAGDTVKDGNIFMAAVAAFVFAAMALVTMLVYLFILLIRMIVLWVLIVLSPLAFALSVIPQTQKYAQNWWQEFSSNVIVGPMIAFFLWLSFVTLSSNVHGDIKDRSVTSQGGFGTATADSDVSGVGQSSAGAAGITKAMSWDSMANFFIAIGMLFVGAKKAQESGAMGADMMSKVGDFGKKVATIASGVAAGQWLAGKGKDLGGKVVKGTIGLAGKSAWYLGRGEHIKNWGKRTARAFGAWRSDTGFRAKTKKDAQGNDILDKKGRPVLDRDKHGNIIYEETKRGWLQRQFHRRAAADAASRKKLRKTENFAKNREELLEARTTGVPTSFLLRGDQRVDALDRIEQGMLVAEKARSAAKTEEFQALGQQMIGTNRRFKDGKLLVGPTMEEQIVAHKERAATTHAVEEEEKKEARKHFFASEEGRESLGVRLKVEMGAKGSDSSVAIIQDEISSKNLIDARGKIEKIIKEWEDGKTGNVEVLTQKLKEAAEKDMYVAALRAGELAKEIAKDKGYHEAQAVDSASDAAVNIQKGGRMPSTATDKIIETEQAEYAGQERAEASRRAADRMFFLMSRGKDNLSEAEKNSLMGAWSKVDSESWNDDFMDYFVRTVKQFREDPSKLSGQQKIIAEQMDRVATEAKIEFEPVEVLDEQGKKIGEKQRFKGGYDRRTSSMLQTLAVTGGDIDLWKAHNSISEMQKTKPDEYKKADGYWGAAAVLQKAGGLGGKDSSYTVSQMETAYAENQDRFRYAAKQFKKNGIDGGHWESVLNQEHDDQRGITRLNTELDAQASSVTEIGKRVLNEVLKAQVHSYGNLDLGSGLMQGIVAKMFGALTAQLKEDYEVKGMPFRTLIKLLGGHESETELRSEIDEDTGQKYSQLGGQKMLEDFISRFGNTDLAREEMDAHLIKDFLIPELQGNKVGAMLILQRAMGLSHEDATHGNIRLKFDSKVFGKVANFEELVSKLESLKARIGLDDTTIEQLKAMRAEFKLGVLSKKRGETNPAKKED